MILSCSAAALKGDLGFLLGDPDFLAFLEDARSSVSVGRGRRLGVVCPTAATPGIESRIIRFLCEDIGEVGAIRPLDSAGVALDAGMS